MTTAAAEISVLVTGSSGFVGSAICEELVRRDIRVVGADCVPPAFPAADWADRMISTHLDIRDSGAMARTFRDHAVSHIIHAAAITPDITRERIEADVVMNSNVTAACRLMMAARDMAPTRIVYLSSISAYGSAAVNTQGRFDERDSIPQPETLYGISKHAAERAMQRLAELYGLDLRVVRLGPLFGPWEYASNTRTVPSPHHQIAMQARAGQYCRLPRTVPADWLYARDAAKRIVDILFARNIEPSVVNLGGGAVTTLTDWCEALACHVEGFRYGIDAEQPTVRYGYETDRPALDNRLLDTVSSPRQTPLVDAAGETLAWLDRFLPPSHASEKTA